MPDVLEGDGRTRVKVKVLELLKREGEVKAKDLTMKIIDEVNVSRGTYYNALDELLENKEIWRSRQNKGGYYTLYENRHNISKLQKGKLETIILEQSEDIVREITTWNLPTHNDPNWEWETGWGDRKQYLYDLAMRCQKLFLSVLVLEKKMGIRFDRPWDESECDDNAIRKASEIEIESWSQQNERYQSTLKLTLNTWLVFYASVVADLESYDSCPKDSMKVV